MELLNEWFGHYEPLWLFIVLVLGLYHEWQTHHYSKLSHKLDKLKYDRYKGWKEAKKGKDKEIETLTTGEMR